MHSYTKYKNIDLMKLKKLHMLVLIFEDYLIELYSK